MRDTEYQVLTFLDALEERGDPRLADVVAGLLADFDAPFQRAARYFGRP